MQGNSAEENHSSISAMVLRSVHDVVTNEDLAPNDELMESGMDSLGSTELINLLKQEVGDALVLPSTFVYDYPTPAAITDYLIEQLAESAAINRDSNISTHSSPESSIEMHHITHHPSDSDCQMVRLMSISKTVIAIAVLRLSDLGLLKLDQPVHHFLPYFQPNLVFGPPMSKTDGVITIQQLLTHTSGLGYGKSVDSTPDMLNELYHISSLTVHGLTHLLSGEQRPLEALVRRIGLMPLRFEAGAGFEYSIGHSVVGDLIETVCGQRLITALEELVFTPLGIQSAHFVTPPAIDLIEVTSCTRPSQLEWKAASLELGDCGLAMQLRDLHTLLSSINPHDKHAKKLLREDTLKRGLTEQLDCTAVNDIAITRVGIFEPITNWSILGPLRHGELLTVGGYGILSVIDRDGELHVVSRDQMLAYWNIMDVVATCNAE